MALARTQAVLSRALDGDVSLATLIREELNAQAHEQGEYDIEGPDVPISPKAAEGVINKDNFIAIFQISDRRVLIAKVGDTTNGSAIFPCTGVNKKLGFIGRVFGPKRPQIALKTTLAKVFGEKRLGESSSRLVIPSYDCVSGNIHLFKTVHHRTYKQDYLESAVDVAIRYVPALHVSKNS